MSAAETQPAQTAPRSRALVRWLVISFAALVVVAAVLVSWVASTQSGLRWLLSLSEGAWPEGVQVGQVSGRLLGPLRLDNVRFDLETAKGSVESLTLDWRPSELVSGVVQIDKIAAAGVALELLPAPSSSPAQAQDAQPQAFELPVSLESPVDVSVQQLELTRVAIQRAGFKIDIDALDAGGSWIDTKISLTRLRANGPVFELESSGGVDAQQQYPLALATSLVVRRPEYAEMRTRFDVTGDAHSPKLQLAIEPPYDTRLSADISSLFANPSVEISLSSSPQPLKTLSDSLPSVRPRLRLKTTGALDNLDVACELNLSGEALPATRMELAALVKPNALIIERLETTVENQPQPILAAGEISFSDEQVVDLTLRWPALKFAVEGGDIDLRDGRLQVGGTLQAYRFTSATQADYLGQSNPLTFEGTGTQSSIRLDRSRAGIGVGELSITGSADWSNGLVAATRVSGTRINPGLYLSELPGLLDINFELTTSQNLAGDWAAQLSGLNMQGELAELRLNAVGDAGFTDKTFETQNFKVKLGDNQFAIDGTLGQRADLRWSAELGDLGQLSALAGSDLAGSVVTKGQLRGAIANPAISAKLDAHQLRVDQQQIELVELTLDGTRRQHLYDLLIETPQADLALKGRGDFDASQSWRYQFDELQLSHPGLDPSAVYHEWVLQSAAAGELAAHQINVKPLCLLHRIPREGGTVCVSAVQNPASSDLMQAAVTLDSLQLADLNSLLPESVRVDGSVSGELNWPGALEKASVRLAVDGLSLALQSEGPDDHDAREDDEAQWLEALKFATSTIEVVPDQQQLGLQLKFPLQDGNGLFASGLVTPLDNQPASDWPIESSLTLALPDLGWVAALSEQLDAFKGTLSGDISVVGTAGNPQLSGTTVLLAPATVFSELGITLIDTRLELTGTNDGLELRGGMRSGKGELKLLGDVTWNEGLKIESTVSGENFLVSDSPLARAAISPDLRASFADDQLKLRGDVVVPLADIKLAKIPDGAVTASGDQRFIEEEQIDLPLDLDAKVRIVLGDDVRFEGLGLQASFGGELTVSDQSTGTTTGKGEILIKEGTYKAYGQDLSVENGKVIFAGGPVEAPGLDIRAVRQATPAVQVGVLVQGSLEQPTLKVFSTPSLPQSDQLSYLVLGRPLSSSSASENSVLQQAAMAIGVEGGTLLTDKIGKNLGVDTFGIESAPGTGTAQAALVVGKYLSPKLYVSYGYGLFEPISTLRMEYQLSSLWRIVTQSTNKATGGDFLWVRER